MYSVVMCKNCLTFVSDWVVYYGKEGACACCTDCLIEIQERRKKDEKKKKKRKEKVYNGSDSSEKAKAFAESIHKQNRV